MIGMAASKVDDVMSGGSEDDINAWTESDMGIAKSTPT